LGARDCAFFKEDSVVLQRHPTVFAFQQIESLSTQLSLEAWCQWVALWLILPVLTGSLGAYNAYDDRPRAVHLSAP
jgi:hypothetical protein